MEQLAADPNAFIRPSPSGGVLGGVTRKTRETIVLFEAAGFDVIIVETVGVGQSETTVHSMVDFFLLLLQPGTGDELQGIKRGVVELADAILINKADGASKTAAEVARGDYDRALHYLQPVTEGWQPHAYAASSLTGEGIPDIWAVVEEFCRHCSSTGALERRRRAQELEWVHTLFEQQLRERFLAHPAVQRLLPQVEAAVLAGRLPATAAAKVLLDAFGHGR
jgi:LAO/AO transport system kinase